MNLTSKDICLQLIDQMDRVFRFAHTADNELWIVSDCKTGKLLRGCNGRTMLTILTAECLKRHFGQHVELYGLTDTPTGHLKIKTFSSDGIRTAACHNADDIYQEILSCLIKVIKHGNDRVMIRSTFANPVLLPYLKHCSKASIKTMAKSFNLSTAQVKALTGEDLDKTVQLTSSQEEMIFDYVNYKGEKGERRVGPPFSVFFGNTEHHKEDQWLMEAWDIDKEAPRVFAMKDIKVFR